MIKKTFIYVVVTFIVGFAAWLFLNKVRSVSDNSNNNLLGTEESSTPEPKVDGESLDDKAWIKLPNGLQLRDVVVGYGKEAREGDVVAAHYSGTLSDGTKFDNSYDRGQPFAFILGGGMVIKGWDLGLVGMKIGGKRKLIIPPDLAYGDRGTGGGLIPPGATLYFDIELVGVETPKK